MTKSICVIQGHPSARKTHFCHALAGAYRDGAKAAGHKVSTVTIATMDLPFLRDPENFETAPPLQIQKAQEKVKAADHLAIFYPLWMGTMPAMVKAFFEQLARNSFAIQANEKGWPRKMLKGKSARVIVTMGMPAAAYRLFFGAHGVKNFETSILGMSGFKPIRDTLIGGVGALNEQQIKRLFSRMHNYGAKAS